MATVQVRRRSLGPDGTTIGTYDENPILNLTIYQIELPYGESKEYAENVIVKKMIYKFDLDGLSTTLMECKVD